MRHISVYNFENRVRIVVLENERMKEPIELEYNEALELMKQLAITTFLMKDKIGQKAEKLN